MKLNQFIIFTVRIFMLNIFYNLLFHSYEYLLRICDSPDFSFSDFLHTSDVIQSFILSLCHSVSVLFLSCVAASCEWNTGISGYRTAKLPSSKASKQPLQPDSSRQALGSN
ncbi:unnamed protein product, partial [Cuscuta epithymum]